MSLTTPNVLIIHTDQQNSWTLGCYGGSIVDTPAIDRVAHEGALFTNFFTNSAICTPSRSCFVTGRYPHANGAYANNIPLNPDEITFARVLADHGYRTGYIGKWHLDGSPRPGWMHPERSMGFDHCRYMFNRGHWKKIDEMRMGDVSPVVFDYREIGDERTYGTDWLTSKTIDFIDKGPSKDDERPFCCMLSIPDPHTPFTVRPPYDRLFDPAKMPVPASFTEKDLPSWAAEVRDRVYPLDMEDREDVLRQRMAQYCGEVKLIDDSVGRLLRTLDERGVLDDTIVVFTTDHGDYMGEHGLNEKNHLYETAYRIPFVIRWPAGIRQGTVIDNLVSTVDFQPTLFGLMGIPASGREQGKDASGLFGGNADGWDDTVFLHHCTHERAGIFTPQYELAYVKGAEAVLFDRKKDPEQLHNLFNESAHSDAIRSLTKQIVRHHMSLNSPASAWLMELS